jgi:arylformamidase
MTVWPGDPAIAFTADSRIEMGDSCNTSVLTLNTHTGTHCDAPWHFIEDGKRLDEIDPGIYFGDALVIDCGNVDTIHAHDLGADPLPPRILLKTRNQHIAHDAPFQEDFVAVEEDAARRMVAEGVRLVGIDYLSIAPFGNARPTHEVLLSAEVFIVEGLRLADIAPGRYAFVVLPLPVAGADGAPCRAFIGETGAA